MSQIFENKVKPTIVGGGIGGLSLAVGLQKHGIFPQVYEAAADINEVGAGIMLASNAMQVFKHFGVYEEVAELGNHISRMLITDANFKTLSNIGLRPFEAKYGVHNVTIHRAVLQKKLVELVGREHIHLGKKLQSIETGEQGLSADFGDEKMEASILIGADGIHSTVRSYLDSNAPIRRAYQKCWRGVTEFELPKEYSNAAIEAWGTGKRFGLNRLNDRQVYWYALVNSRDMSESIDDRFDDFHPLVKEVLQATEANDIIENEIIDLRPFKIWHQGNICLIGDAAHATTPNLGQGACQAIEDAFVLSQCMQRATNLSEAFATFQRMRIAKAHQIVSRSWTIGKMSQLESGLLRGIRNFAMKLTPDSISAKQLSSVFDLSYVQA